MKFELIIENNGKIQIPLVTNSMTLTTERKGSPGKLNFTVVKDVAANFQEGNPVRLRVDDKTVFYGFVFTKKRDKRQDIGVVSYDQLRYLLNKDTYVYTNKRADEVVQMIADDFELQTGSLERASYNIPTRVEDNTMLMNIIQNALDLELTNRKKMFVLFDDCGKISLKSLDNMKVEIIIDEETGENFDYSSTIDDQTYNKIKLSYENEETGKRDIFIVQDGDSINRWGILQYFDTLQKGENGETKAMALLDLYKSKTRKLKIKNAFGDIRVRGGSLVIVKLNLGDINVQNYMIVEKAVHSFNESDHFMDLVLRGGEFVG